MIKVSIKVMSYLSASYHIIEATFSCLNLLLSQKSYSYGLILRSYLKCALADAFKTVVKISSTLLILLILLLLWYNSNPV